MTKVMHTVRDTVRELLRQRIMDGEWKPGEKLPSIREIAREYDVAIHTASKAIHLLREDELVTTIRNKGIYVSHKQITNDQRTVNDSWQYDLIRKSPYRSFSFSIPQGVPEDTINLATGTMAADAVPIQSIRAALKSTARKYVEAPVWLRSIQGEPELREWFSENMRSTGVKCSSESIIIVSSTHQAFRIIANSVIDPGDIVLVESPADPIVLGVFELAGARCIGLEVDNNGVNPMQVEDLIVRHRPKLIITCPTGQIPTGVTMPVERRIEMARIADAHDVLLIEYDNGTEIYFDEAPPPPIKSWDRNHNIAFIRDISRITMAGFRVNALAFDGPLQKRIIDNKRRDDLLTSTLGQAALLEYVEGRDFQKNLRLLREYYRIRRDAMVTALEKHLPEDVKWVVPNVGFHIWLTLPKNVSSASLSLDAALLGVIVAPSSVFSIDGTLDNAVRLTYSTTSPEEAHIGIRRLAIAIEEAKTSTVKGKLSRSFEVV